MKDYRKEELRFYAIGNILIFLLLSNLLNGLIGQDSIDITSMIGSLLGNAIIGSVIYIYVFIFDSLIPPNAKDTITYFPFNRPGDVIFSEILKNNKDARFTIEQAKKKYSEIYKQIDEFRSSPKECKKFENAQWYAIYRSCEKDERVYTSQKDFLLMRDISILTIDLICIYLIAALLRITIFDSRIIVFLLFEFALTNLAAKSKAKRFAFNVIAVDLSKVNRD